MNLTRYRVKYHQTPYVDHEEVVFYNSVLEVLQHVKLKYGRITSSFSNLNWSYFEGKIVAGQKKTNFILLMATVTEEV